MRLLEKKAKVGEGTCLFKVVGRPASLPPLPQSQMLRLQHSCPLAPPIPLIILPDEQEGGGEAFLQPWGRGTKQALALWGGVCRRAWKRLSLGVLDVPKRL